MLPFRRDAICRYMPLRLPLLISLMLIRRHTFRHAAFLHVLCALLRRRRLRCDIDAFSLHMLMLICRRLPSRRRRVVERRYRVLLRWRQEAQDFTARLRSLYYVI